MKTYALITGASQGLGKALALECANREMNLLLLALPNSGLPQLSHFIKQHMGVDVHHLELDLSVVENYYLIADYVRNNNLKIQYLINNAGVLSRGFFDALDDRFVLKQIAVNITAPTMLIKLLLPYMKSTNNAAILNISSMASFFALPKKQVYGATKAYLTSFSKSLAKELKKDNIAITIICPGGLNTTTRLCYQNRILSWIPRKSVLNPEDAAGIAINAMMKRRELIVPGFINKCLLVLDKLLPRFIKDSLTSQEINKFPAGKLQKLSS
ncbi:SDR family NAD(P)-dependent oxidoreductase [Aestuariivivens insulae]|uniref:SDR family NAD(P)-dependent oxidoreductase n=1 Tax=Aestuariivivens insulae TaxID=1621988 RepID=UPI001F5A2BEA|nr:SDR family NAD(P)-dependent oxidoreductase [Aestuariivivens insulae]